jgi:transcription elongation factor SPT5
MDYDMYAVKCKDGKEREAAMTVLRKAAAQQHSGKKIHVSSVLTRGTKGYIYMEAKNDDAVMQLCKGLNLVTPYYKNGLKLVEIRQRTNVLLVAQRSRPVKKGEFVRLKRPVAYKGDLAEVMEIMPGGSRCILRYVPRIDYAALGMSGAEKRARKRRVRPTQRLFSEEDAMNLSVSKSGADLISKRFPETGESMDFFANLYLKNGFAHKCVSIKTVTTMNVNPTIEETQMFRAPDTNGADKDSDDEVDSEDESTKTSNDRKSLLAMVCDRVLSLIHSQ